MLQGCGPGRLGSLGQELGDARVGIGVAHGGPVARGNSTAGDATLRKMWARGGPVVEAMCKSKGESRAR